MAEEDILDKINDCIDKVEDCIEKVDEVLAKDKLIRICYQCNGVGTIPISGGAGPLSNETCSVCNGTGKLTWGHIGT